MEKIKKIQKLLAKNNFSSIKVKEREDIIYLSGELDVYEDIVNVGKLVASTKLYSHVVSEIKLKNYTPKPMRVPNIEDKTLDGKKVDVLVIGGGVTGSAILRELTRYNLSCLLIDKEEDLGMHASSRNDGCIHVGIDLHKGSKKLEYLIKSKKIIKQVCKEIDIEYHEDGQTVGFKDAWMKPFVSLYLKHKCKTNEVTDMQILKREDLLKIEPNISEIVKFGAFFPHAGAVCPYNFTIALAESAVINGAEVSFKTYAKSMEVVDGEIKSVTTNRGIIYPKIVINAAGVFSEDIAKMAEDHFFSIHPRKGTDSMMDKSATARLSRTGIQIYASKKEIERTHSKGGGIIPTVDNNILVGPDAIEVIEKEDFSTSNSSVSQIFGKHEHTIEALKRGDIITYFSGVRAATYEEDFVIQKGKWTRNIIHAAGIQSPGLTCAPAIGKDCAKWAAEMLGASINKNFNPIRKGIVQTRKLSDEERDALIKKNPKYGHIICRCEEISEGEIIDAIHSVIPPTTIDGIKRRVRAGMGRCQGGFCQPNVAEIYARETNTSVNDIVKKGDGKIIFRNSKE